MIENWVVNHLSRRKIDLIIVIFDVILLSFIFCVFLISSLMLVKNFQERNWTMVFWNVMAFYGLHILNPKQVFKLAAFFAYDLRKYKPYKYVVIALRKQND